MSTSARRKRSKRFYWAEIGFLVLGIIALKPEILTELIPTGRSSSQLASQAALNQVALNNAFLNNAALASGGNAVFVPVPGTLLYPANYVTPATFASTPVGIQTTQPTNYTTASYSTPYVANGVSANHQYASQTSPAALQAAGWGQHGTYGDWSTTYAHSSNQPSNPTQNVTSMMASTSPSGLQVVWPDSYRPIAPQPAQNYIASNTSYLVPQTGSFPYASAQSGVTQYGNTQYGNTQYGNTQYSGAQNAQYRGATSAGVNVTNGYSGAMANQVASGVYPQYNYPQSSSMQGAYPTSTYPASSYAPNAYPTVNSTTNSLGGYRTTVPTAPSAVGRY